eukprot:9264350-Prorocentrum_lima.AAC.1
MTSSLVGSEMCIRDRKKLLFFFVLLGKTIGLRGFDRIGSSPVSNSRTVSYTHLTLPTICSV